MQEAQSEASIRLRAQCKCTERTASTFENQGLGVKEVRSLSIPAGGVGIMLVLVIGDFLSSDEGGG